MKKVKIIGFLYKTFGSNIQNIHNGGNSGHASPDYYSSHAFLHYLHLYLDNILLVGFLSENKK